MSYHENVLSAIGRTPLVKLQKVVGPGDATVLVKLEFLNPGGSITLKWKCPNPPGTSGTVYHVARRIADGRGSRRPVRLYQSFFGCNQFGPQLGVVWACVLCRSIRDPGEHREH